MTEYKNQTNDYRINIFLEMPQKVQERCTQCDHYYNTVRAWNGRLVRGHFCVHWPDIIMYLSVDKEYINKNICPYSRDRNTDNPYNSIRKNKEYFDISTADCYPLL